MKNNVVIFISPPNPYVANLRFSVARSFKMSYIKKEVNDVVSFWHTEEHGSFLPVDTIILGLLSQACPKYLKFAYLCNVSRNTWRMKLIFCLQINPDIVYKLIVSHWMCVARHTKLPKITSLQYLCSISRKM